MQATKRCEFDPWVRRIPWRRAWQPIPVFLPGESHGQRSLVGHSLKGLRESDMTERLSTQVHTHTHTHIYIHIYVYTHTHTFPYCLDFRLVLITHTGRTRSTVVPVGTSGKLISKEDLVVSLACSSFTRT